MTPREGIAHNVSGGLKRLDETLQWLRSLDQVKRMDAFPSGARDASVSEFAAANEHVRSARAALKRGMEELT